MTFAESCVFSKQSPGPFHCSPLPLQSRGPSRNEGAPSSEVTVLICRVPSQGITQAPVDIHLAHVCPFTVRSPSFLLRGFSWQRGINHFAQKEGSRSHLRVSGLADLPTRPPYVLRPAPPVAGWPTLLRHPIVQTRTEWYGNINPFPIDYAFRPRLRDRLTLGGLPLPRNP